MMDVGITLDLRTLFVVATCVTTLLGLMLLFVWRHDRTHALAWWGTAYLVGGLSVAAWSIEDAISPPLPTGIANAFLFFSCGMAWNAARVFHGRQPLWGAMTIGAAEDDMGRLVHRLDAVVALKAAGAFGIGLGL
jgi:hypothetical protein